MAFTVITNEQVEKLLDWNKLLKVTEEVLVYLTEGRDGGVSQPMRTIMRVPKHNGTVVCMEGYSARHSALATKILSYYPANQKLNLPYDFSKVFYFDEETGVLKAVIDGSVITARRTAAASVVATKVLLEATPQVLAIIGCGAQGHSHAEAFTRVFNFSSIRLWNRSAAGAKKLADKLKSEGKNVDIFDSVKEAVHSADVVCTVTGTSDTLLFDGWVKEGAIINAVGAPFKEESEIHAAVYQNAYVVADSKEAAELECGDIERAGVEVSASIGEIISGKKTRVPGNTVIFKSQGIGVEDAVCAKLIYDEYMKTATSL